MLQEMLQGRVSSLSNHDTDDLRHINLYYTDTRLDNRLELKLQVI